MQSQALLLLLALFLTPPKPVPDIALKDLTGQKQHLAALKGNLVVLNFWATWCGPCQEELPVLSQLRSSYAGQPIRFITVSIDEDKNRDQLATFLEKRHLQLDTWTGASPATMTKVGLNGIVPSTLILDQTGQPVFRITGEAHEQELRDRLDWLLHGRNGQQPTPDLNHSTPE